MAGEPNLSGNLAGGGDSSITGRATYAVRTVETSATRLVSQLRLASQLMTQMKRDSEVIAKNLGKLSTNNGFRSPSLVSTGGSGGAASSAANAAAAGKDASARMQGTFSSKPAAFTGAAGTVAGMAAGYAATTVMNPQGMFGADWKSYANTAATMRMLAPGRFTNDGAYTQWLTRGIASGTNPQDAIAGGAVFSNAGFTGVGLNGSNFDVYNQRAAAMQRFTPGMTQQQSAQGMASFQSAEFVNSMQARGIFMRNPLTGQTTDPQQAADLLLKQASKDGTNFYKANKQQRLDWVQQSLMSGGGLDVDVSRSGLDDAGQGQMRKMLMASALAGKPVSSMGQGELQKFLDSKEVGTTFGKADARNAQAVAKAQSIGLDASQDAYSAVKDMETAVVSELTKHTTLLQTIAKAQGGNAGLGGAGSGMMAALGGAVGSVLPGVAGKALPVLRNLFKRGASAAEDVSGMASKVGGAAETVGKTAGGFGGLLGKVAAPLMFVGAGVNNWSGYYNKYSNPDFHAGIGEAVKDSFENPLATGFGSGVATIKGLWRDITGTGGSEVGSRGAKDSGGTTKGDASAQGLLGEAMKWLGTPYSWGGGDLHGPSRGQGKGSRTVGFDCSGFVRYVFAKFGVNLPRTSQAMAGSGSEVTPKKNARKGDLLIITWTDPNGHVAIYLGGDKMIHAPKTGDVVKIANVPWSRVSHVRRVIGAAAVGESVDVGKGVSKDLYAAPSAGLGSLAVGAQRLWDGTAAVFFGTPQSNAMAGQDQTGGGTSLSGDVSLGSGGDNGQKVFNTLTSMGFSKQAAAGVVGNLQQESGVNPLSRQKGGPGMGIMQWTDNQRWAQLTKWAKNSKLDPNSLDTQVKWMVKEMKDYGVWGPLSKLTDVHGATDLFEKRMEAAGMPMMANRYKYADSAYQQYSKGYSEGAWRVTKDQVARIHDGEMIIPSNVAETLRTSIRDGFAGQPTRSSGGGQNVYVTINASFAPGTTQQQALALAQTFRENVSKVSTNKTIRTR